MPRTGTGRVYQRSMYVDASGSPCKKSDPGAQKQTLPTWWIQYGHRGKTYRETSGSAKKVDATKLLKKRLGEMGSGKFIGPSAETVTFKDLKTLHLTDLKVNGRRTKWARTAWKPLVEFFKESRALDVTTQRVKLYIVHRQEEGAANATIQKELAALRRAFNLAVQSERLATRPHVPNVRVDNTREGFLEGAELDKVIAELPEDLRPVARFAALTGWRKGEVLSLPWSQVDFEAGVVRLAPGTTKNKEGREFPFRVLPPLAALLEEQRARTRAIERKRGEIVTHVFHRDGQPIRSMRGAWDAACERAGLKGTLFHDLRRSAVRNFERAGVPRSVAMKLTGHKTESVYRRYAIADAAALREGVEKLAKLHGQASEPRKVVPIQEARG